MKMCNEFSIPEHDDPSDPKIQASGNVKCLTSENYLPGKLNERQKQSRSKQFFRLLKVND